MAYRSTSRGGRQRAESGRAGSSGAAYARGRGSRRDARGDGGPNTTAVAVGIGLLIAVVVAIVIVSGGKKNKKAPDSSSELTGDSVVDKGPQPPKKVERDPPPDISPEIVKRAKEIVVEMEADRAAGDRCYEEAMAAKQRGDDDTWLAKLHEAADYFGNIRDKWNDEIIAEIEGELPAKCDWDAEEVANYHLGKEGGKVTKALERLAYVKKQLGVR